MKGGRLMEEIRELAGRELHPMEERALSPLFLIEMVLKSLGIKIVFVPDKDVA